MIREGEQYNNWVVLKVLNDEECLCECQCEKHTTKIVNKYNLESGRSKSCGCTRYTKKRKDLVGQTFGDWTVVQMLPDRKCLCKCVCGFEKIQYHSNITRTGNNYKCEHVGEVGKTYGNWLVLKELGGGKILCQCQCENKTVRELYKKAVLSGETKSCGCKKFEYSNIIGKRFGEWAVLKCVDRQNEKYLCECSCDNHTQRIISKVSLTHGRTKSCGCKQGEYLIKTLMSNYGENCSARINNPREQWQIDTLNSPEKMLEYLKSFEYKPTTQQLAKLLNVHDSTVLPRVHQFGLEDFVDIQPMISQDEIELHDWIASICSYPMYFNVKNIIQPYELDIYIPDLKIAIEFNGNYWHSTEQKKSTYHQDKTMACTKQGIHLIHIFEYEWKSNKDKIKKFIQNIICNKTKLYARDTSVVEVNEIIAKDFINENHLQGYTSAEINIALYKENNIVGIMTFGMPRFDKEYQYEIIRFCYKSGTSVTGGAQKMLSYFINKYHPTNIVTYSDITKFTGNIYTSLGFKVINITKPNYVWINTNTNKVLSRYQTQKANLIKNGFGNEAQTEDEIMKSLGYLKIYNSGNLKLYWEK